jgi:copper(I)-binding protein
LSRGTGDSFPLTLTFEHAQPITVTVKVEAVDLAGTGHEHGTIDGMPGQMGHTP